jgi:E1A/CREB-binding protein
MGVGSSSSGKGASKSKSKSKKGKRSGKAAEGVKMNGDPVMQRLGEIISNMKSGFIVAQLLSPEFAKETASRRLHELQVEKARETVKQLKDKKMEADPSLQALASSELAKDETCELDETMDCEVLDTRQVFLNLCQGNHYQYDQLRRAKHSSMMVLYHLCNPDAPKFLSNCTNCLKEINSGNRYHCGTCSPDFDLCHDCYITAGAQHPHPLKAVPVRAGQGGQSQSMMTEDQRRNRERSIHLHMQLLLHASQCKDSNCPSSNCNRMKGLLAHGSTCGVKAQGGCHICRRIWALLQMHARQCKREHCMVPKCAELRDRFRKIAAQQQQMDNRRRQHFRNFREKASSE